MEAVVFQFINPVRMVEGRWPGFQGQGDVVHEPK
jgi:hypothetical protein